jgi:hypothetical protein
LPDADAADVAQDPAALEMPDVERRQKRAHLLSNPQLPQRKPETMFLRCRPPLRPTTIRNCLFTLLRIEEADRSPGSEW